MKKALILSVIGLSIFAMTGAAFAVSGLGEMAARVTGNLGDLARLITAASYVGGMGFVIGGLMKLKQYKDNPTQVQMSNGIVLLFIGAALIFIPSVYGVSGATLFGQSGQVAGVSGITSFGAKKAGS